MSEEEQEFGSTIQLHIDAMYILWGPIINLSIILAIYTYRRYAVVAHIIISAFVGLFSLAISLNIPVQKGFIDSQDKAYPHECLGMASMICIIIQMALGIIMKTCNVFNFGSQIIRKLRFSHLWFGYATTIMSKVNYYIIIEPDEDTSLFYGLLGMDIAVVLLIIIRKVVFPKLEKYPASDFVEEKCQEIKSLKQLEAGKEYIIFNNHVFDLAALGSWHPVGLQVIRSVVNRDVDRYLYGMYSSEKLPEIPEHSHSFRSLKLLNPPVAKLGITSVCSNTITEEEFKVSVDSYTCISRSGDLYEIYLKCLEGTVVFQGYQDPSQLGRFRSLNLDNSVTRLYTNIYFTLRNNTKIMEEIFPEQFSYLQEHAKNKAVSREGATDVRLGDYSNTSSQHENIIPVVLKRYLRGGLTEPLVQKMMNNHQMTLTMSSDTGQSVGVRPSEDE